VLVVCEKRDILERSLDNMSPSGIPSKHTVENYYLDERYDFYILPMLSNFTKKMSNFEKLGESRGKCEKNTLSNNIWMLEIKSPFSQSCRKMENKKKD